MRYNQCCGSGSSRISIILPDPDWHPEPADLDADHPDPDWHPGPADPDADPDADPYPHHLSKIQANLRIFHKKERQTTLYYTNLNLNQKSVFRIRIHLIRIRIPDPDPEPGF